MSFSDVKWNFSSIKIKKPLQTKIDDLCKSLHNPPGLEQFISYFNKLKYN